MMEQTDLPKKDIDDNRPFLLLKMIIVFTVVVSIVITMSNIETEIKIFSPDGNESFHLIKTIECTSFQLKNETFLIPLEYAQRERFFYESLDSSYARGCWYDAFKIEDLSKEWIESICSLEDSNIFTKTYVCDKGFIAEIPRWN